MMGWGRSVQKWYGRSGNGDRQLDISNDYIGYYTDNGKNTLLLLLMICIHLMIKCFQTLCIVPVKVNIIIHYLPPIVSWTFNYFFPSIVYSPAHQFFDVYT